jgi:membrane-bound lytic murein transglycosylase D
MEVLYFLHLRSWMDGRKKTFLSCCLFAAAFITGGCGSIASNQQSKFQTSFLPPAPQMRALAEADIPKVVLAQPNIYLQDLPAILDASPSFPRRRTSGDILVDRAQRRFEAGKRLYQAQDLSGARREFDTAVDLMLQASDETPADRVEYEKKFDEMVDSIHRFDLSGMGASASLDEGKFEKAPLEDILQMTFPVDPRLKDKVREQVKATVSQLPLSVNDTVLGYINYFSNRGHRTIVAAYQRSGRYRSMIQRILDEEGVPQELIHLAQAESGFIPRAVSRMAAGGMWQFLTWRGEQYGLMQTKYTDDRMDPEMATRAAAHHLHDLYNEFGDWYLAIAAYNCGPGNIEKAVERTGYADFWELRDRGSLPSETTNYVPIILAMTIMEKNAAEYGLDGVQMDAPLEYDTVKTDALTGLALVADITDTPLNELAALNPAALKGMLPEGHTLHIPKGTGNAVSTGLALIPAEHRATWRMHKVGPDDTLTDIGKRYGVTPASIMAANRLTNPRTEEGDRLMIPAPARPEPTVHAAVRKPAVHRAGTPATTTTRTQRPAAAKATAAVKPAHKPATIVASAAHQ